MNVRKCISSIRRVTKCRRSDHRRPACWLFLWILSSEFRTQFDKFGVFEPETFRLLALTRDSNRNRSVLVFVFGCAMCSSRMDLPALHAFCASVNGVAVVNCVLWSVVACGVIVENWFVAQGASSSQTHREHSAQSSFVDDDIEVTLFGRIERKFATQTVCFIRLRLTGCSGKGTIRWTSRSRAFESSLVRCNVVYSRQFRAFEEFC